ncbi:MAG: allantoicase [Pseudomonadota bacterium]
MTEHNDLPAFARDAINLASPRLGAEAIFASDDFFAPKDRLLQDQAPVFIADKFDDHGKWMDGWESRRRRDAGHDHCIVRLGIQGEIEGVDIDTSHFTGNYPRAAALEACLSDGPPDAETQWTEIVPATPLGPDSHHFIPVANRGTYNHLRFNIYPDGGVARLRVYGEPVRDLKGHNGSDVVELSALSNGGRVIGYNDAHYGSVWSLLLAGRGVNMGDGWETRRRREPGNDWIIVQLGAPGTVERIEVDTAHFKGNYPDRCSLQGALIGSGTNESVITQSIFWDELLGQQKLQADHIHLFEGNAIKALGPVSHVKLNIFPDGGISRLRIFGQPQT